MRILLVSDPHSSRPALVALDRLLQAERFDLVLCPGDVTDRHDRKAVEYFEDFADLITVKHRTPFKMVFGNNDSDEVINLARRREVLLHGTHITVGGYEFVGIGDFESHPAEPVNEIPNLSDTIVITHRPPSRTQKLKLGNSPMIHIAGHFHQRAETWQLGRTLVVQVPAALNGRYARLQLPDKQVEFRWFKDF